ncbi:MAG: PIN domain-containing protein, partial [Desulfosalsimonadaceae bacterium]|nr:PIN domain-containing protein [Desulfosalsimonadaceae bacterium]
MIAKTFVDTNILVYAHDLEATAKRQTAAALLAGLWENETWAISTQVLHEFYVTVTRKIPKPLSIATARSVIENYLAWPLIVNDAQTLM